MHTLYLMIVFLCVNSAWAQGTAPLGPVQHLPAKKLLIVEGDGRVKKAPTRAQLRLHAEVLNKPEAVGDILRRNGLSEDSETVGMLKRLNPAHDFSRGTVAAGTKLVMFAPEHVTNQTAAVISEERLTFDSPLVAKWAVRDQVARAAANFTQASKLPRRTFENTASQSAHLKAVSDINTAAKVL